ncbi:GPI-anchored surface protein, putative, partial [Bodo saltans]
ALFAFHQSLFAGSAVYIVELSTVALIGSLDGVGSAIVSAASLDSELRLLFVAYDSSLGTTYRVINLFGIQSVTPNTVDSAGGAVITLRGIGFPVNSALPVWCNVSNTISPAVVANLTTMYCATALVANASGVCAKDLMSIIIGGLFSGRSSTSGSVGLFRPVSALCTSVVTVDGLDGYGPYDAATTLVMYGYGFVASNAAACRLQYVANTSTADGAAQTVVYTMSRAVILNSTTVQCLQPAGLPPSRAPTGIAYSHDGAHFGASVAPYVVVGPTAAAVGETNGTVVVADTISVLPAIRIYTTDAFGNRRLLLDANSTLTIRCSSLPPAVQVAGNAELVDFPNPAQLENYLVGGVATASGVHVGAPSVGLLTLYCFAPLDLAINATVTLTIVAGEPAAIFLVVHASWRASVTSAARLDPAPQIWLVDRANNFVSGSAESARIDYTASYPDPLTGAVVQASETQDAAMSADGTYTFATVVMRTAFDAPATMKFTVASVPQFSYAVAQELCVPGSEYAVTGSFQCARCPDEAVCDGTSTLTVRGGFWRAHRDSQSFYDCPAGTDACPGGTGVCNEGYAGVRCGACADGFGRSGGGVCSECPRPVVSWVAIVFFFIAFFVVVFVLSILTMPATCYKEVELFILRRVEKNPLTIVVKLIISHGQMISMLPLRTLPVPSWLNSFVAASSVTKLKPNFSFFGCELAEDDIAALHLILAMTLVSCAVFVPISFVAATLLTRRGKHVGKEQSALHIFGCELAEDDIAALHLVLAM